MWLKIISSTIIFSLFGCASPLFKNFEIKKMNTCIIDKVQAPNWICRGDYQTKDKFYVVSIIKSKKIEKWRKVGKIGEVKVYEKTKEPVNYSDLFVNYYKLKALQQAEDKIKRYNGKIVDFWVSPYGDFYELVEFEKK